MKRTSSAKDLDCGDGHGLHMHGQNITKLVEYTEEYCRQEVYGWVGDLELYAHTHAHVYLVHSNTGKP